MIVQCSCGKSLRVPENLIGKKMKCPACGRLFRAQLEMPTASAADQSLKAAAQERVDAEPEEVDSKRAEKTPADARAKKQPPSNDLNQRAPKTLLIASGGLGTVAIVGFVASGILFNLGYEARGKQEGVSVPVVQVAVKKPREKDRSAEAAADSDSQPTPSGAEEVKSIKEVYLMSLSISSDGRKAFGTTGNDLGLWDLEKGVRIRKIEAGKRQILSAFLLPGDREALLGRGDGSIEVIDLESGTVARTFTEKLAVPFVLKMSADGKRLFSGGVSVNFICQWDVATGREINRTDQFPGGLNKLSVSADGSRAITDGGGYGIQVWDIAAGPKLRRLSMRNQVFDFSLYKDGTRVLYTSTGSRVIYWDVDEDREIAAFEMSQQPMRVVFTPSGQQAIVGGQGSVYKNKKSEKLYGPIWVLDLEQGRQIHEFKGHFGGAHLITFTPDGKQVISHGFDHTLRIWQMP